MNINFSAALNDTSIGYTAINWLKELVANGHNVTLWPIQDLDKIKVLQTEVPLVQKALQNQASYDANAVSVRHFHPNMLAQHIGKGPQVGSTFFELTRFRPDELHHLHRQDALITASKWGLRILEENGLRQPKVAVPCGVDRTVFNEYVKPSIAFDNNPTVFLNCSKTEVRKGHLELIDIFNRAFSPSDNVALVMNWRNRFFSDEKNKEWDNLYKNSPMGSHIIILEKFLDTQEQVSALYASADCGVFPSKAEGFGLAPLEMLSMGKSVIATNFSGHTEFLTDENSLLIEIDSLEEAFDGYFFTGGYGGEWAELGEAQIDQAVEHMRSVHRTKQGSSIGVNEKGIETAESFSWGNSVEKLTSFLKDL